MSFLNRILSSFHLTARDIKVKKYRDAFKTLSSPARKYLKYCFQALASNKGIKNITWSQLFHRKVHLKTNKIRNISCM